MPGMLKTHYIKAPDRGVDRVRPTNVLDDRQWLSLMWTRGGHGKLERLPGYTKKITSGVVPTTPIIFITHFRRSDNLEYHFIGDFVKLYRWDPSLGSITSVSDSLGAFAQNIDNGWSSAVFLDQLYVNAVNRQLLKWSGSGDFTAVGADSFAASAIGSFKNYLLAAGKVGDPLKAWWAANGTDNLWTAAANNDAGSVPLKEFSDLPQRWIQLGPDIMVLYGQKCTNVFQFIGGDAVFAQANVSKRIGSSGPGGVVDLGFNKHFVVGFGDFFKFDGLNFVSCGESIRDAFFNKEAHLNFLDRTKVLFDQVSGLVYVFFVSKGGPPAQTYPDMLYVYDTIEDQWYGPTTLVHLLTAVSELNGSFIITIDSVSAIIDTVATLIKDYHTWSGIGPVMAFGGANGQLYGFDNDVVDADGSAITRSGETGDKFIGKPSVNIVTNEDMEIPNQMYYITKVYYEVGDDDATGTCTLEAAIRVHLNEAVTYVVVGTITYGPNDPKHGQFDYRAPVGRWVRFRLTGLNNRIALRDISWDYYVGGKVRR